MFFYKNGLEIYLYKFTVKLAIFDINNNWSRLIYVLLKLYEKTQVIVWRKLFGLICLIYSYFNLSES